MRSVFLHLGASRFSIADIRIFGYFDIDYRFIDGCASSILSRIPIKLKEFNSSANPPSDTHLGSLAIIVVSPSKNKHVTTER